MCPMWWTLESVYVCACGGEGALAFEKLLQQKSNDAPRGDLHRCVKNFITLCKQCAFARRLCEHMKWTFPGVRTRTRVLTLAQTFAALHPRHVQARGVCVACVYVCASPLADDDTTLWGGNGTGLDEAARRTKARLEGLY